MCCSVRVPVEGADKCSFTLEFRFCVLFEIFISCMWVFRVTVYMCITCVPDSHRGQRGGQIHWNCSYTWLCVWNQIHCSTAAASALNHRTIPPAHISLFLKFFFVFMLYHFSNTDKSLFTKRFASSP